MKAIKKLFLFLWSVSTVASFGYNTTCAAANLPSFLAPETNKKIVIGLAALGGAAEGFATETGKQYDLAQVRLKTGKPTRPRL